MELNGTGNHVLNVKSMKVSHNEGMNEWEKKVNLFYVCEGERRGSVFWWWIFWVQNNIFPAVPFCDHHTKCLVGFGF